MLVQGDQLAEDRRRELGREDRRRRTIAGERPPRLVGALATEGQCFGLGDEVGDEKVVVFSTSGRGNGLRGRGEHAKEGARMPMKSAGTISVP